MNGSSSLSKFVNLIYLIMRPNYIYFAFPFFSMQESVYERMKKSGGANPFNLFVMAEMECMHRLLAAVRETLLVSLVFWSVLMNLAPRWLCTASYPGGGGILPNIT